MTTQIVAEPVSAESLKERGNLYFSKGEYEEALKCYQEAIRTSPNVAIYHSNASACCLHLGEYGQAAVFATEAIRLNSALNKGYYRRACAMMGLQQWKAALDDLRRLMGKGEDGLIAIPSDVSKKVGECERELQKIAFAKAIHVDVFELDMEHIREVEVDDTYGGPRIDDDLPIGMDFVNALVVWLRQENKLHPHFAYRIMYEAMKCFKKSPNVVRLSVPLEGKLTVCGDIHGQFFDLVHIFQTNGYPSAKHKYLFNGDLVDRGAHSVEVFLLMMALKVALPNNFFVARGNHESESVNRMHGFSEEVSRKYASEARMFSLANSVLHCLPLVHIISDKYFVVHGGLPMNASTLSIDDIQAIDRMKDPEPASLMSQLLWSDPQDALGISPSHRGEGILFGPDISKVFLQRNGLDAIIRSHVWEPTGYKIQHNGKCITIFSAPNYTDAVSPAALINIDENLQMKFVQFDAAPYRGKARKPKQFAGFPF